MSERALAAVLSGVSFMATVLLATVDETGVAGAFGVVGLVALIWKLVADRRHDAELLKLWKTERDDYRTENAALRAEISTLREALGRMGGHDA